MTASSFQPLPSKHTRTTTSYFNGLELNISLLLPKFFTASDSAEQESETFWTAYRQISLVTGSDLCDTASIYSVHFFPIYLLSCLISVSSWEASLLD